MSLSRVFDAGGEVHDPLKAKPDGLHPGLAVTFAPEESTQSGDGAHDVIQPRRGLRHRLLGEDVGGLPFIRLKLILPATFGHGFKLQPQPRMHQG